MKEKIEKLFIFLDKKHIIMSIIAILLVSISGVMYYFIHTNDFGYNSTFGDNVIYAFAPIIFIVSGLPYMLSSKINKRIITSTLLIIISVGLCEVVCGLYCAFVKDLPPEAVFIILIYYFCLIAFSLYGSKSYIQEFVWFLKNIFKIKK